MPPHRRKQLFDLLVGLAAGISLPVSGTAVVLWADSRTMAKDVARHEEKLTSLEEKIDRIRDDTAYIRGKLDGKLP